MTDDAHMRIPDDPDPLRPYCVFRQTASGRKGPVLGRFKTEREVATFARQPGVQPCMVERGGRLVDLADIIAAHRDTTK